MSSRLVTPWAVLAGSASLIAGLSALLLWKDSPQRSEPIILQCAEALRESIEEIVPIYERETGQRIEVRFGESRKILTDLEVTHQGDVFLPADDSYIADAEKMDLMGEVLPLARMNAIIVVNKGYEQPIAQWDDLFRYGARFALPNPKAAAVSRSTSAALGEVRWTRLRSISVEMGPVTQVANAVNLGQAVDAGLIWDNMLSSPHYANLKPIKIKEMQGITGNVRIGVVKNSPRHEQALRFAQFVNRDCADIIQKHGFTVANTPFASQASKRDSARTDEPRARAAIVVYAGAMLRPAIDKTIREFAERENVTVDTNYNGCGILVGQMKTGQRPDVYFACDASFMNDVQDLFEKPKVISKNQLVIAVKKGNPHGIRSLKDLGKEGLRVGVGHEQKCALGAITQGVLIRSGSLKAVEDNIKTRAPSGDMLINQLLIGSLDAVVAYVSNVNVGEGEGAIEAIKIEEVNCRPTQPIAISRSTAHPDVVKRLLQAIESAKSKERFEKLGFGWEIAP
jgi:molybdate transport system substrate-binding protein